MPNMTCCASISFRVAGGAFSTVRPGRRGVVVASGSDGVRSYHHVAS
jgi:hypothetical protein